MAQRKTPVVASPKEIGLLASPTRIDIVDTLEAFGTAVTVAQLASHLGRAADGMYFHLRLLTKGGLIEEHIDRDGIKRYRTRSRRGDRLRLQYKPGLNPNAKAVNRVATSVLRVAARDFARALADPATIADGTHRELWAARGKGWVGRAEMREINDLLVRVMDLLQKRRKVPNAKLIAVSWVLAPLEVKPIRGPAR